MILFQSPTVNQYAVLPLSLNMVHVIGSSLHFCYGQMLAILYDL